MTARMVDVMRRRLRSEEGALTAMAVTLIVMLLVVAGLVVDGGFVLNARAQTYDDVEQAARVGANQINEDALRTSGQVELIIGQAEQAAEAFVWGLPRGDQATNRGGYNFVNAVAVGTTVTVRAERDVPTTLLQLVGVNTLHVEAEATADAQVGIDAPF